MLTYSFDFVATKIASEVFSAISSPNTLKTSAAHGNAASNNGQRSAFSLFTISCPKLA